MKKYIISDLAKRPKTIQAISFNILPGVYQPFLVDEVISMCSLQIVLFG